MAPRDPDTPQRSSEDDDSSLAHEITQAAFGDRGASSGEAGRTRVPIPPWIQLVGLPLLLVFIVMGAMATSRAVIIFLVATLIALLLNPLVRLLTRVWVPRAVAVFVVFGLFSLGIVALSVFAVDALAHRAAAAQNDLPQLYDSLDSKIDSTQEFLDDRGLDLSLREEGDRFVEGLQERSSEITGDALEFGQHFVRGAAEAMLSVIAVIVITIYMLLDAPRIGRLISSILPSDTGVHRLFPRLERALFHYVVGQTMTSIVMGVSAALGIWLLGATGIWPEGQAYAAIFGVIVGLTQFAPSIGPIIGSIPPLIAASFDGLVPVLGVLILFLLLHQIEGHIVVPKLLGAAIAVHPLLVIFGILAGAQLLGAGGVLLALPLLAVLRELALFVRERFELADWPKGRAMPVGTVDTRASDVTAEMPTTGGTPPAGGTAPA